MINILLENVRIKEMWPDVMECRTGGVEVIIELSNGKGYIKQFTYTAGSFEDEKAILADRERLDNMTIYYGCRSLAEMLRALNREGKLT